MRAVVQTVSRASVSVAGEVVGAIGEGLLVLVGVTHDDTADLAVKLASKVYDLRLYSGDGGQRDPAAVAQTGTVSAASPERGGEESAASRGLPVLVVSQFTLYADARKGRRPSWSAAAPAETAEPLVTAFVDALRARGTVVETGVFRAHMLVESVNVGPLTVIVGVGNDPLA